MKVIIAGSSGMIGNLILQECLSSENIHEVISLVRRSSGLQHKKLHEVVLADFIDFTQQANLFNDVHAAFFCVGVYTGKVPDEVFKKITVDYAVSFAKTLRKQSPQANFCLLSGAGADRSERNKLSFARYKGMAENQIAQLGLQFYTFRPGYIYPVQPREEPNFGYQLMRFFYPLIKLLGTSYSIKSSELAKAMFNIGLQGAKQEILENQDILKYR